ncbi:MAG: hypothetical protein Q9206_004687, partial [Seirophora lacunosa]
GSGVGVRVPLRVMERFRVVRAAKHLTGQVFDQIRHAEGAVSVAPRMNGGKSRQEEEWEQPFSSPPYRPATHSHLALLLPPPQLVLLIPPGNPNGDVNVFMGTVSQVLVRETISTVAVALGNKGRRAISGTGDYPTFLKTIAL